MIEMYNWRDDMLKKLLILVFSFCLPSLVIADIATDIASGVHVLPTTQNAKNDNVFQEDAVVELIHAGISCVVAIHAVTKIYELTPLERDGIITAVIITTQTCETAKVAALYSAGNGLIGIGDIGSSGGGPGVGGGGAGAGGSVSPN